MKRIIAVIVFALVTSGAALAQGKGNGSANANKGKGPKQVEDNSNLSQTVKDILTGDQSESSKNKKNKGSEADSDGVGDILVDIVFGESDRETIRDYYSGRRVNVDTLPPGIAKNLQRGKPLPPGIAKKSLPDDLESRLPQLDGFQRQILGNDIALIDEENNLVVDIIRDVLGR